MANTPNAPKVLNLQSSLVEPHFTIAELAESRKVSRQTMERLFADEPGVMRIGHGPTRTKRQHYTLRVPASVAERVFSRLAIRGKRLVNRCF